MLAAPVIDGLSPGKNISKAEGLFRDISRSHAGAQKLLRKIKAPLLEGSHKELRFNDLPRKTAKPSNEIEQHDKQQSSEDIAYLRITSDRVKETSAKTPTQGSRSFNWSAKIRQSETSFQIGKNDSISAKGRSHNLLNLDSNEEDFDNGEPMVMGTIAGRRVCALPDLGAAANFMSLQYARHHAHAIERSQKISLIKGNGSSISSIGTTDVAFAFHGENTGYVLRFHVLTRSLYDVVLGGPFLRATKTFTEFAQRITRKAKSLLHPHRVCLASAQRQRMHGWLAGEYTEALPDTGSDISLISAEYARMRELVLDDSPQHRRTLQFIDGSTAETSGIVHGLEWKFNSELRTVHTTDFYVLKDLPVDVLFSDDFLHETDAFIRHEDSFEWDDSGLEESFEAYNDAILLNVIRILQGSRFHKVKEMFRRRPSGTTADMSATDRARKKKEIEELDKVEKALKTVHALPEEDREAELRVHRAHWAAMRRPGNAPTDSTLTRQSTAAVT